MRNALVLFVLGLGVVAQSGGAMAQHRELGAHEHGRGVLNIAIEGNRVTMELEVPGADIVGFEHAATTRAQMAAVEKAKKQLLAPLALFAPPAAAGCTVSDAKVDVEADDHDHAKGDASAGAGKAESGEHGHSEFHAQYALDCATPARLTTIDVSFFRAFPAAQKLDVNVITAKGQSKFEATRAKPHIDLAGVM